jgi:hypothetical protein
MRCAPPRIYHAAQRWPKDDPGAWECALRLEGKKIPKDNGYEVRLRQDALKD